MSDRTAELRELLKGALRRATHVDGSKEDYVNPLLAQERQLTPVAESNNRQNMKRQRRNGTELEPSDPYLREKQPKLDERLIKETKNHLP